MADLMGKIGDYHLLQLLWQGQLASVYLGEHRQYGSRAAIKILHSALADEEAEKFLAQAQITANLDHPHIVRLLDGGIENAIPYLVMQYIPNGSLRQLHPRGSQLPLPTVVSYVRQVASALQYIHDQGLIHCDVKPHNMLLNSRHEVMLSDFGIAVVSQKGGYRRISVSDFEGTVPMLLLSRYAAGPASPATSTPSASSPTNGSPATGPSAATSTRSPASTCLTRRPRRAKNFPPSHPP